MQDETLQLVREIYGGTPYEYYPIGQYIVVAPVVEAVRLAKEALVTTTTSQHPE